MMRSLILSLLFLLPPTLEAGQHWEVMLPGGAMRFQGELLAEACSVETSDRSLTVNMGQLRTNMLHAPGEDTDPIEFDIHLRDCNKNVSQYVGIAFNGVADGKNPDVISIGEGPNIAQDIGVAIFDATDTLIPLNSPPRRIAQVMNGETILHFVAKYRATGHHVTGGKADAQAWFSLTYE
jgi:fimbrial protein